CRLRLGGGRLRVDDRRLRFLPLRLGLHRLRFLLDGGRLRSTRRRRPDARKGDAAVAQRRPAVRRIHSAGRLELRAGDTAFVAVAPRRAALLELSGAFEDDLPVFADLARERLAYASGIARGGGDAVLHEELHRRGVTRPLSGISLHGSAAVAAGPFFLLAGSGRTRRREEQCDEAVPRRSSATFRQAARPGSARRSSAAA